LPPFGFRAAWPGLAARRLLTADGFVQHARCAYRAAGPGRRRGGQAQHLSPAAAHQERRDGGVDGSRHSRSLFEHVEARYKENSEKNRLAALWLYQVSPMEGGTQSTATIDSSQPSGDGRVRLVLRRHTQWGQNAFLYGEGHGFVCRGNCTIATTVDGKSVGIKAFAPTTGEPALMIRDDKAFIAMLQKAKKITMNVTLVDGEKKEALVYEVGGFDPSKWAGVGKGKKK
jgi:hypothetical protein